MKEFYIHNNIEKKTQILISSRVYWNFRPIQNDFIIDALASLTYDSKIQGTSRSAGGMDIL